MQSWTLSGREAEALHAQEEDEAAANMEDEDEEEDPIKKIIQSRYCSLVLLAPFFCSYGAYSCQYGFSIAFVMFFFPSVQFIFTESINKSTVQLKMSTICFFVLTVPYIGMVIYSSKYRQYLQYQYVLYNLLPGITETSSDPGRSMGGGGGVGFYINFGRS